MGTSACEVNLTGSKPVCCMCKTTVGTFTWVGGDRYKCQGCRRAPEVRDGAKSTFPFTTSNITGEPMTVNSMRELRQLENRYGVHSAAYNFDHQNLDR